MVKRKAFRWDPFQEVVPQQYENAQLGSKDWEQFMRAREEGVLSLWANNLYLVHRYSGRAVLAAEMMGPMIWLSIRCQTRGRVIRDWRHLWRIKCELVGIENEAVELYPAATRLVDSTDQFHLWAFADPTVRFPFGYVEREVALTTEGMPGNCTQRPFEWREENFHPVPEGLRWVPPAPSEGPPGASGPEPGKSPQGPSGSASGEPKDGVS